MGDFARAFISGDIGELTGWFALTGLIIVPVLAIWSLVKREKGGGH